MILHLLILADLGNVNVSMVLQTPEELANAKALQTGRLAIGSAVVFMAYNGMDAW